MCLNDLKMPHLKKNSKITRLKKRSDFLHVQKNARKWVAKGLIIEVAPNDNLGLRVGFTVSKRVSKLAVTRNLVKRRLRSMTQEILSDYAHHNLDVVLIGRLSGIERDYNVIKNDLVWCLKKLDITPS